MPRTWEAQPIFDGVSDVLLTTDFLYGNIRNEAVLGDQEQNIPVQKLLDLVTLQEAYDNGTTILFTDSNPVILDAQSLTSQSNILQLKNDNLSTEVNLFELHSTGLHKQQPLDIITRDIVKFPLILLTPNYLSQYNGILYLQINTGGNTDLDKVSIDNPLIPSDFQKIAFLDDFVKQTEEHGGVVYTISADEIHVTNKNTGATIKTVESDSPFVILNNLQRFIFRGDTMFVTSKSSNGIPVISFANPTQPVTLTTISTDTPGVTSTNDPIELAFYGEELFISLQSEDAIQIVNIPNDNPANATGAGRINDGDVVTGGTWILRGPTLLRIVDTLGFVHSLDAASNHFITLFDAADKGLEILSQTAIPEVPTNVIIEGNYMFIGFNKTSDNILTIYDISNPSDPIEIRTLTNAEFNLDESDGFVIRGNELYIGCKFEGTTAIAVLSLEGMYIQSIQTGSALVGELDVKNARIQSLDVSNNLGVQNAQVSGALGASVSRTGNFDFGSKVFASGEGPANLTLDFQYDYSIINIVLDSGVGGDITLKAKNVTKGHKIMIIYESAATGQRAKFSENIWLTLNYGKQSFDQDNNVEDWAILECVADLTADQASNASTTNKILVTIGESHT